MTDSIKKSSATMRTMTITTSASKPMSSSSSFLDRPIPYLNITTAIVLWLIVTTIIPLLFITIPQRQQQQERKERQRRYESITNIGLSLLFFNNLNILISFCEIALGRHIRSIQRHYKSLRETYGSSNNNNNTNGQNNNTMTKKKKNEWEAAIMYLTMPLSIRDLLFMDGGTKWSIMWSTYSLWDPSYQNNESFGFFIDVGNGWSTIVPCLLWNIAILSPHHQLMSNNTTMIVVLLGFVGTATYWQILYGTIIYWLSYVWNGRYKNKPWYEVFLFVGVTNGIWFVFPIIGLYTSYSILLLLATTSTTSNTQQHHNNVLVDIFGGAGP